MSQSRRSSPRAANRVPIVLAAAGLVLAALVGALVFALGSPSARPAAPTATELPRPSTASSASVPVELARDGGARTAEAEPVVPAPAPAAKRALRGRVVADGEGVPNAEVVLVPRGDGADLRAQLRVRTGPDGAFHFDDVLAGAGVVLKTTHAGFAPLSLPVADPGAEEVVLALSRDSRLRARITGEVVFEDGTPAAGADVAFGRQAARTDGSGRFELALTTDAAADEPLVARHAGLVPARIERFGARVVAARPVQAAGVAPGGAASVPEVSGVRLVLGGRSLAITGTVLDGSGRPAKGWRVELANAGGADEVSRTDRQGRFVLSGLAPGAHVLRARGPRPEDVVDSEPLEAGARDVVITAPR